MQFSLYFFNKFRLKDYFLNIFWVLYPANNLTPKLYSFNEEICIFATHIFKSFRKASEFSNGKYLDSRKILPLTQSGFRKGHSCCSELFKETDDIL